MADPNEPIDETPPAAPPALEPIAAPVAAPMVEATPAPMEPIAAPVADIPAPPPAPPTQLDPPAMDHRRREPEPDNPYGKGDFDAVFEGRSLDGLGDRLLPTTCYLLMIIAPLGLGLPALPAAILAWMAKDRAPEWLRTHYLFILRTFGIALGAVVVAIGSEILVEFMPAQGVVMAGSAIWWLILVVGVAWFVLRSAVGMGRLRRGEAFKRYRTWLV